MNMKKIVFELIDLAGLFGAGLFGFYFTKQNKMMMFIGGVIALFGISRHWWFKKIWKECSHKYLKDNPEKERCTCGAVRF